MRILRRFALTAFSLAASACAGVNTPSDVTGPNPITIEVIGINGARSFSPNPGSIPAGSAVVWHNWDIETHHIVLDDRSVDTGILTPGRSSAPMPIGTTGRYHCTIHPSMVGTITH
jgi:plastocyanin